MTQETFAPAVLIMDDDPAIIDMTTRRFYSQTTLGVVTAKNLPDARRLVESRAIRFDAILSDISITADKQDVEAGLESGMDLLALVRAERPEVQTYVLSVYAETPVFREEATKRNLNIREWFQKLAFGGKDEADQGTPWHTIERELYRNKLTPTMSGDEEASPSGEDFTDAVRQRLHPITRTYLQLLPPPYEVKFPIEVLCRVEEGSWIADALKLGLLQAGIGDTQKEALEDLGTLIIDQYETLQNSPKNERAGYAEDMFKIFEEHIQTRG